MRAVSVATSKLALAVTAWSTVAGAATAAVGASLSAPPATPVVPVPRFAAAAARAGHDGSQPDRSDPRTTLLPSDCTEVLAGPVNTAALLAQPAGSLAVHTLVGVGSRSVGMLEQLTCTYQRLDQRLDQRTPELVVRLAAFTDPEAAARQRNRNLAAEAADTTAAHPDIIGKAHATLLAQPAAYQLLVACERYTITLSLARGAVADRDAEAILTDLTRRIWPNLPPPPTPARAGSRR